MNQVFLEVDMSMQQQRFIYEFRMSGLPLLSDKLEKFLSILVISKFVVHSLIT
jgi:callose synthase